MSDRDAGASPPSGAGLAGLRDRIASVWAAATATQGRRTFLMVLAILVAGVSVRLYAFNEPILDHHFLRQVDTAAIARNFDDGDMNIFMPQVDWRGSSPGYVEVEFQLFTYATAVLYRVFGQDERLGRALNIVIYLASAIVVFFLARRLFDRRTAILSVLFFSFAALNIYFTRTFQPDGTMILASLVGVYFYWKWTEENRWRDLVFSALGIAVALLIKPINVYLALPLFYLTYLRFGWGMLRQPALYAYGVFVLIPPALWYAHAYELWETYGNTFYRNYSNLDLGWYFTTRWPGPIVAPNWPSYGSELLFRLVYLMASPAGLLMLVLGTAVVFERGKYLLPLTVAGISVSVLVLADQHRSHDYYQLPMVWVVTIVMAAGAARLWDAERPLSKAAAYVWLGLVALNVWWYAIWRVGENAVYGPTNVHIAALAAATIVSGVLVAPSFFDYAPLRRLARPAMVALVVMAVGYGVWQSTPLTQLFPGNADRPAFGARIAELTEPNAPMIIAYNWPRPGWVQHRTAQGEDLGYDPVDFYYANRKGWSMDSSQLTPAFLEELRRRGARYFATYCCYAGNDYVLDINPAVADRLACAHTPLEVRDEKWAIYRLDDPDEQTIARCGEV